MTQKILSESRKEADEILILPGKSHETKCVCFLLACRKHVLLVSWFVRCALYIFLWMCSLDSGLCLLCELLQIHYSIFWYCHVEMRTKSVCCSLVTASLLHITTLLKWLLEVFQMHFSEKTFFVFISRNPALSCCWSHFSPLPFLPLLSYFTCAMNSTIDSLPSLVARACIDLLQSCIRQHHQQVEGGDP